MRLKRILCAILVFLMITSLAACSQNGVEPTKPSVSENTTPTETLKERKLIFMDYGIPVIEPFAYFHEEIAGVDRMFTNTCFDFDIIDMYSAVQNSSFFSSSNGRNLQMINGEEAQYYHPDYPMYTFTNGVYCELGGTDEKPDMTITVNSAHQTAYFNNPNAIRLVITYNPEVEGYLGMIQDYPHEILTTLLGWQFADFVVYAKDSDGLDYYADEVILPTDLSENADSGSGGYMFCRTFEENQVTYEIFFHEDIALGDQYLIGRPVENTTYNMLPYKIDSIVDETFGGADPSDIYSFGDKLFTSINPEYETVLVSSIRHEKMIDDGNAIYSIGFTIEIPDTYNGIDCLVTYTMSEGTIIDSDITWYLSTERTTINENINMNTVMAEKTLQADINRFIEIVKLILPDSTITVVEGVEEGAFKYQINYTLLGIPGNKTFDIAYSSEHIESYLLPEGVDHVHTHNGHVH